MAEAAKRVTPARERGLAPMNNRSSSAPLQSCAGASGSEGDAELPRRTRAVEVVDSRR